VAGVVRDVEIAGPVVQRPEARGELRVQARGHEGEVQPPVLELEAQVLLDRLADHPLVEGGVVGDERVLADELEEAE
jgi:hypothetical protein